MAQTLKLEGDCQQNIAKSFEKKKPAGGAEAMSMNKPVLEYSRPRKESWFSRSAAALIVVVAILLSMVIYAVFGHGY